MAAWRQKLYNAGIFVKLPTKNANVSQIVAVAMLGPTFFKPSTTLSYKFFDP